MNIALSAKVLELRQTAERLAREVLAEDAERVDRDAAWPERGLKAIGDAGLMGLHVPRRLGGAEEGLVGLVAVVEALARACPSTAMCYGMHCVATAVIAAKATPTHEQHYLKPIAGGKHITSLALSEAGTGAHFYLPNTKLEHDGDWFVVTGTKQFVTSGGYADSYVISTVASEPTDEVGELSCLILDSDQSGITWLDAWDGFGMRGNSSRGFRIDGARVPADHLLGEEGDQIWYVFEVVTPYFLIAMSATYLGIAQAALEIATHHVLGRRYEHSGEQLAHVPVLQHRLADMWVAVEKTRLLIYSAANRGDMGDPEALPALLMCKADVADAATHVANEAMTLCGGIAYRDNSTLSRLLRDVRASHVMTPTTDILKQWTGRALLGLPLL